MTTNEMFWDKAAGLYDLFETLYNGKVYKGIGLKVAEFIQPEDKVLECACGTGAISEAIAPRCRQLIATDLSEPMLRQARRKCSRFANATFAQANIMQLDYPDHMFDRVVAGNVIHLLDDPAGALHELERVCRPSGLLIIPTYINIVDHGKISLAARCLEWLGVNFKREFDYTSYQQFFATLGYTDVSYHLVEGRMPCAIAVIQL